MKIWDSVYISYSRSFAVKMSRYIGESQPYFESIKAAPMIAILFLFCKFLHLTKREEKLEFNSSLCPTNGKPLFDIPLFKLFVTFFTYSDTLWHETPPSTPHRGLKLKILCKICVLKLLFGIPKTWIKKQDFGLEHVVSIEFFPLLNSIDTSIWLHALRNYLFIFNAYLNANS